ncbi:hypothetical protein JRG42_22200 [Pseudomonas granadensis]|uniref:AAA domain-containing protein n=1 Tax=Pseudomonas granadensis TaxID=1421430 RepID=UPI0019CFC2E8|nr:AAA domain-containing protein [Pseudomonas granadensis]MBN6775984.1 hypothetical protein [Pseudomonas granadensis]MBN6807628.1 hypothetical protein [Pseudomonas granadensis]MBN6833884.1 hypothetical protein [Pseudomonas granadensis]MBN6841397.1 hypothetical protein [Pseudomonas granadensis]MBN6870072.1 hypothetical protein [Pseudomonas granadensis]
MQGKISLKKQSNSNCLEGLSFEKRLLKSFEKETGSSSLRIATDENGHNVLVKTWPRDSRVKDTDLHEVWKNEIRQLYRLSGYPGVSDYIAELRTAALDEGGYYLLLNAGQRRPLENLLKEKIYRPGKSLKSVESRRLTWSNMLRIAKGLEILHLQGLLHRNLNSWSVLTAGGEEPDFQLTGFEWSMRIISQAPVSKSKTKNKILVVEGTYSFIKDWQQFGQLAADLLGLPHAKLMNRDVPNNDVLDGVSADEVRLLRELTRVVIVDRVDGATVIARIEKILLELESVAQSQEFFYSIIFPLGRGDRLAATIREASERQIEVDDEEEQLNFIKRDLTRPVFQALKLGGTLGKIRFSLRGDKITYTIDAYRRPGNPPNWEYAYCAFCDLSAKVSGNIIYQIPLANTSLNILSLAEMRRTTRSRGRVTPWTNLLERAISPSSEQSSSELVRKSLILTQIIDYLFAASEVFPVYATEYFGKTDDVGDDGTFILQVSSRPDRERDELSKALGMGDPLALRLEQTLLGGLVEGKSTNWMLTESSTIGEKSDFTEWRFHSSKTIADGSSVFIFVGDAPIVGGKEKFLISSESNGRDSQLKRRLRSFSALGNHEELSKMLHDPRSRIMSSYETFLKDAGFSSLDESKQKAFSAIIDTLPLYLVQGPPGVGKTRLVRELVRQTIENDKSSRLLLSAQSNYAVDHLMQEIEEIIPEDEESDTVIVRCVSKERRDSETRFDVGYQTRSVLARLCQGDLLKEASGPIRSKVQSLVKSYSLENAKDATVSAGSESSRRAVESLVLRSANLVFATTNSGDLENLINDKSQFDWVVVEEAGKATGGELVSPLLLSPKRLMIGDHKQLPPYGADKIIKLLRDPNKTKRALEFGNPMIGRHFRDSIVEEVFEDIRSIRSEDPETAVGFFKLCDEARRNFLLFESIIEDEFERQRKGRKGAPIASSLHQQHRMHPAISEIVSHAFYNDELLTDEDATHRFSENIPSVYTLTPEILPDCPVVWVDMPWISNTAGMKVAESLPHFVNEDEVEAVTRALSFLRGRMSNGSEKKPTLAVLSPYSRQVQKIDQAVRSEISTNLANLNEFSTVDGGESFCYTVDSFQGSEADCIVISLVRNNGYSTIYNALGFLSDARRMNVLMSRAKWKIIIVGSLDFLSAIVKYPKSENDSHQIKYLERLLSCFSEEKCGRDVKVVSSISFLGGAK